MAEEINGDDGQSKPKPLEELRPLIEDFNRDEVRNTIKEVSGISRHSYDTDLNNAAHDLRKDRKVETADALQFLAYATHAVLNASDVARPFHPVLSFEDSRGIIPDDFDDEQIKLLAPIAELIDDPIIKARLFDMDWLRNRNLNSARAACAAYLDSAEAYLNEKFDKDPYFTVPASEYIERAVRLSFRGL